MPGIDIPDNEFNQLSRDDRFLQDLNAAIQTSLSDECFGVEQLAKAMSFSRAQLYRRLNDITGKNASQYIREYRLKKAMGMLKMNVASVSEIAYQVGFNSPSYFNRCFHEFYGTTPGSVEPDDNSDEDIKKIKPIYSERFPEQRQSILLNNEEHLDQRNKSDTSVNVKIKNGITKYIFNRTSFIIFLSIILFTVLLLWKYVPDLLSPEELQTGDKPIVAVLPFRNDNSDPKNDYVGFQFSEEIRLHLQKIQNLVVKKTIEAGKYDLKGKSSITLGSELNVSHILEGSVRKAGKNIRVMVFLYDAETGEQIWADSYDGVYSKEIFDFQSNVARKVCRSLNAVISGDEEQRLYTKYTDSLRSYDLTILGEYEMYNILNANSNALEPALTLFDKALKIDPGNIKALVDKGKALFYTEWPERSDKLLDSVHFYCDRAIELDPEYSESYLLKAMCYNTNVSKIDKAVTYFLNTIELSPNHAEAYGALGQIYYNNKHDYSRGLFYLNKARELNVDTDPSVYFAISFCLMHAGFYEKSREYLMQIITYDGLVDFSVRGNAINNYSWMLILEQRFEEALVFLDTMINYLPEYKGWCRMWQVQVPIFDRNFELAQLYLDTLTLKWVPPWQRNSVAWMYQQTGRDKEATEILDNCIELYEKRLSWNESYHNYFILSSFYALKGEKDKAIELFARSIDAGEVWGYPDIIESDFTFDNLKDEPEFRYLAQRIKDKKVTLYKQILEMEERGEIDL